MTRNGYITFLKALNSDYPRYGTLFDVIYQHRCKHLVEIGVYNGRHARQMIRAASAIWHYSEITYNGFDLFESMTEADYRSEFSKIPKTTAEVGALLVNTAAEVHLHMGDTRDSLPLALPKIPIIDFVFIDGGHAKDTIAHDWGQVEKAMQPHTVVVFDDYYDNPMDGYGCQELIDGLDRTRYSVEMSEADATPQVWGTLYIRMAIVRRK